MYFSSPEPKAPGMGGELIVYAGSVVRRRRQSTSSKTFSSETAQPIVTKFLRSGGRENVQLALKGRGLERKIDCSNGQAHMTRQGRHAHIL